jgi:transposase-like protein
VLALVKTIFAQPNQEAAEAAVAQVLERLEPTAPKAAAMLRQAETEILAYLAFPREHHSSITSTDAIERVNAEVDRRAKVLGIFPNSAALLRLATAVLQDQHDEWPDGKRHFSQTSFMELRGDGQKLLTNPLAAGLAA